MNNADIILEHSLIVTPNENDTLGEKGNQASVWIMSRGQVSCHHQGEIYLIFCPLGGSGNTGGSPESHHGPHGGGGELQGQEEVLPAGVRGGQLRPGQHGHHRGVLLPEGFRDEEGYLEVENNDTEDDILDILFDPGSRNAHNHNLTWV